MADSRRSSRHRLAGRTSVAAVALALLALLVSLLPVAPGSSPSSAQVDPQYFPETGYRIANPEFFEYFQRRGGARTFGFPVSNQFLLLGTPVQIFQRLVMQQRPDGSVGVLNLLDGDLMPYTRINGSTFPSADPFLLASAPSPAAPDYAEAVLDFVRANAPDEWEGLPVGFYQTFLDSIAIDDAFPDGQGDADLLPLIALELWGVPTSRPARDPANPSFVYLRWQRGIMHFDATTGRTQGLLLGDYFKAILTGLNLPPDLEAQAAGSRFYRQYNPFAALGLNRPEQLPGTNLLGAFIEAPPVAGPPTPTPPISYVPPVDGNPSTCLGDERMTFSPNPAYVGQELLVAVTSAKPHVFVRLTGTEQPTFKQERSGQLGRVWEWTVTPTFAGRHDFTFYIDSTVVCTANFVEVRPAPNAPTATPGFVTPSPAPPPTPDFTRSTLSASKSVVTPNGTDNATITVTLIDASGLPVPSRAVELFRSDGNISVLPSPTQLTNFSGQAFWTVSATCSLGDPVTFWANDVPTGKTLGAKVKITFPSGSSSDSCTSPQPTPIPTP